MGGRLGQERAPSIQPQPPCPIPAAQQSQTIALDFLLSVSSPQVSPPHTHPFRTPSLRTAPLSPSSRARPPQVTPCRSFILTSAQTSLPHPLLSSQPQLKPPSHILACLLSPLPTFLPPVSPFQFCPDRPLSLSQPSMALQHSQTEPGLLLGFCCPWLAPLPSPAPPLTLVSSPKYSVACLDAFAVTVLSVDYTLPSSVLLIPQILASISFLQALSLTPPHQGMPPPFSRQ